MNGRKKRVIDGAKSILLTRGFEVTSESENDEYHDIFGKNSDKNKELREYREEIEEKGYDHALLLALNKYTHYAKREAKAAGIETFSIKFPFFNLFKHYLVPVHEFATEEEVDELEKKYSIYKYQLPKISSEDPAVQLLGAKVGDVLKIKRDSPTAGEFLVYRTVVP
ncbi:MAG: DNA-directed RNA polymerase subunit H [Candidatus Hodarchaeales archaeon]